MHVTCVVCVSESGKQVPPLPIISGLNVMKRWFKQVTGTKVGDEPSL